MAFLSVWESANKKSSINEGPNPPAMLGRIV